MESTPPIDEEPRTLLRRIVESQAYRQLMGMNIRGHCLKFLTDHESKMHVGEELWANLQLFRQIQALYRELGWDHLESAVRDRMERIPYPESRLEYAVCRQLFGMAQETAMRSYAESSNRQVAAIARSFLESDLRPDAREEELFVQYCADPGNRPHAQQVFTRWLGITLRSLGRPDTRRDQRAVELGLRSRTSSQMIRDFLDAVGGIAGRCGLAIPDLAEWGIELPSDLAAGT